MTYEEARKQYSSDEAMARAMFARVAELERTRFILEAAVELSLHQRRKAETQLYNYLNPIQKKDKEPA